MNRVRKQRLLVVLAIVAGLATAVALALVVLRENLNYFYTPSQVVSGEAPVGQKMRVGGLVVPGSVQHNPETLAVSFKLTDGEGTFTVYYQGILPDLFRAGEGIVAIGTLVSHRRFNAEKVLAKHDAQYMPPGVKAALEKTNHPRVTGPEPEPDDSIRKELPSEYL